MDLEVTILSEVNQKEKQRPDAIPFMWTPKYDTNSFTKQTVSDIENRPAVAEAGRGGMRELDWKFGVSRGKL